ncbi:MAG TPA: diacylglycerol kinase family protein [Baekduia sp.]|nr:diacylglycerol kinase family protein [Baekduia sp.]
MRLLLCANPHSGGGAADPDALADHLRALGADVRRCDLADLGRPRAPLDAERARALVDGADRLVVAGGDGSIGLAAAAAAGARVPLAVLPTGTANDFARALDLPRELDAACALAVDADAPVRELDLAEADGRPFVNAASAGLAPEAARAAHPLKPRLGPLAYAVGALQAGVTGQPARCRVTVDGRLVFRGRAWQVVVANTGAFGGGAATGGADPADGRLDVAIVPAGSRLALVRRSWAMRRGRLVHEDAVVHVRGAAVTVQLSTPAFNVDGEHCTMEGPATTFTVHPGFVAVVVAHLD